MLRRNWYHSLLIAVALSITWGLAIASNWDTLVNDLELAHQADPKNQPIKKNLINAYNSYGVELLEAEQWQQASEVLRKAHTLAPKAFVIKENLSQAYFYQGVQAFQTQKSHPFSPKRFATAKKWFEKTIKVNRKHVEAYYLLGEIDYLNQNLLGAEKVWRQALKLAPQNDMIANRLAQLKRDKKATASMKPLYSPYFTLRVDKDLLQRSSLNLVRTLESIRLAVSRDFRTQQKYKIPVLIYDAETYYNSVQHAPKWSGGLYDGKIRLPIADAQHSPDAVRSVIVHEYTHAVIHHLTGGKCPLWLNEGLAQLEESKHGISPDVSGLRDLAPQDIDWATLDRAFKGSTLQSVRAGYLVAFSITKFLEQRYSRFKLNTLLHELGNGASIDAAFQKVYRLSSVELQQRWQRWLPGFVKT